MRAILSDIHANLEALGAVLADIARHPVEHIYCLGDLVGHGPNPRECVDFASRFDRVVQGNYDLAAVSGDPDHGPASPAARRSLAWTRDQLELLFPGPEQAAHRLPFLAGLSPRHEEKDLLFVHGSPRDPLREYVGPGDAGDDAKLAAVFAAFPRSCFHGHTHLPGLFTEAGEFLRPEVLNRGYRLRGKTLVNVGSVGHPRDGDWRACYVLLADDTVYFRRVEYDVDATVRKIHQISELDNAHGVRLREGR